jgi:hypothetical protein
MLPRLRTTLLAACLLAAVACVLPSMAAAKSHSGGSRATVRSTGGVSPDDPRFAPAKKGKIVAGLAVPPAGAPPEVVSVIEAANQIVRMPYRYGGGHQDFIDTAYDCSGSVSFALHGANFLTAPLDSSSFMKWGLRGKGKWITVYTNPGHAFMMVAGLRFDTGFRNADIPGTFPGRGPRWGKARPTRGFKARHPDGF